MRASPTLLVLLQLLASALANNGALKFDAGQESARMPQAVSVSSVDALKEALKRAPTSTTAPASVVLAPGRFELTSPLSLPEGVFISSLDRDATIITCVGAMRVALQAVFSGAGIGRVGVSNVTFLGCEQGSVVSDSSRLAHAGGSFTTVIRNCSFQGYGSHSAVRVQGAGSNLIVADSHFLSGNTTQHTANSTDSNIKNRHVGAVSAVSMSGLFITRTQFQGAGRAVLAQSVSQVYINSSRLHDCSSTGQGGAVTVLFSSEQVVLFNVTFSYNQVLPGPRHALSQRVSMGSTPLRVNVSQLARESVALGGGLYVESSHATVQLISCRFIANQAGETETAAAPQDAVTPVSGQGGGAWITAHALTIVRTNFTSNMALGAQSTGGGLHASSTLGPMHLLSASLTANKAGLAGGGAELSTASSLEVHGCNFTANAAGELMGVDALKAQLADPKTSAYVEGGGLRALGPESGQQAVRFSALSTVFNSNYASFHGGGLSIRGFVLVNCEQSAFHSNEAGIMGGALHLAGDTRLANISSSSFVANVAGQYGDSLSDNVIGFGGAMGAGGPSLVAVNLHNSSFASNSAGYSGGAVMVRTCEQVTTSNCTFQDNVATLSGGGIDTAQVPSFRVVGARFINNTAGLVGPDWALDPLNQGQSFGGAISAQASVLVVSGGTLFIQNQAALGGAVYADRMGDLSFDGSGAEDASAGLSASDLGVTFTGNRAAVGGALLASGGSPTYMTGPHLLLANNTAATGGAVVLHASYGQFVRVGFVNNSAMLERRLLSPVQQAWVNNLGCGQGGGGALCIQGYQPALTSELIVCDWTANTGISGGALHVSGLGDCDPGQDCFHLILYNSTMKRNAALGGGGGAVYWQHQHSLTVVCAADARRLEALRLVQDEQYAKRDWAVAQRDALGPCDEWEGNTAEGGYGPAVASSPFALSAPPVIPFYTSGDDLTIQVDVLDHYSQVVSGVQPGSSAVLVTGHAPSLSGQTQLAARNGSANFTALRLRGTAGLHPMSFTATSPLRTLHTAAVIVGMRNCLVGEFLAATGDQCLPCEAGTFNTDPHSHICHSCPPGADCSNTQLGGGLIVPQNGYWHSNPFSQVVQRCPYPGACAHDGRSQMVSVLQTQLLTATRQLLQAQAQAVVMEFLAQVSNNSLHGSLHWLLSNSSNVALLTGAGGADGHALHISRGPWAALEVLDHDTSKLQVWQDLVMVWPGSKARVDARNAARMYEDAMCAEGHAGILCATCMPGWGAIQEGRCLSCPPWAHNTLHYTLLTLLTGLGLLLLIGLAVQQQHPGPLMQPDLALPASIKRGQVLDAPAWSSHQPALSADAALLTPYRSAAQSPANAAASPYRLLPSSSFVGGAGAAIGAAAYVPAKPPVNAQGSDYSLGPPHSHSSAALASRHSSLPFSTAPTHLQAAAGQLLLPPHPPTAPQVPPPSPSPPLNSDDIVVSPCSSSAGSPPQPPALTQMYPRASCSTGGLTQPPPSPPGEAAGRPVFAGSWGGSAVRGSMPSGVVQDSNQGPWLGAGANQAERDAAAALVQGQSQGMGIQHQQQQLRRRSRASAAGTGQPPANAVNSSAGGWAAGTPSARSTISGALLGSAHPSGLPPSRGSRPSRSGTASTTATAALAVFSPPGAAAPGSVPAPSPPALPTAGLPGASAAPPTAAASPSSLQHVNSLPLQLPSPGARAGGVVAHISSLIGGVSVARAGLGTVHSLGGDAASVARDRDSANGLTPLVMLGGKAGSKIDSSATNGPLAVSEWTGHGMEGSMRPGTPGITKQPASLSCSSMHSNSPAVLKILLSYLQVLAMLGTVTLSVPSIFSLYLQLYRTLTQDHGTAVSLDCSLQDSWSGFSKAIQKVLLKVAAPLYTPLLLTALWSAWLIACRIQGAKQRGRDSTPQVLGSMWQHVQIRAALALTASCIYLYPSVVAALLSIFSCADVDHGSNNALATQAGLVTGTYWRKDYEQLCYQGPHLVLTWAVGVPGLLLLAAGLPMACAVWSGHTAARRGYSSRATASAVSSSLLAAEYADRCCMWESVIMLRKLAVAAASVLLVHHAGSAQVLAVMAVILAALALQTWAQPFTSSLLNWLEALSLKATLVHLYLLLLLPLCSSTAQKTAVSMLIVTVDSAALAVLLYHLAVACFVGHAKAVLSTAASLQHSSLQHGRKVARADGLLATVSWFERSLAAWRSMTTPMLGTRPAWRHTDIELRDAASSMEPLVVPPEAARYASYGGERSKDHV